VVGESFESPHAVLRNGGALSKPLQDAVRGAVAEMRRYYSRKVIDVLIKVTKHSLDALRKRFAPEVDSSEY
jgi:dynein heavy chain, axonemal